MNGRNIWNWIRKIWHKGIRGRREIITITLDAVAQQRILKKFEALGCALNGTAPDWWFEAPLVPTAQEIKKMRAQNAESD